VWNHQWENASPEFAARGVVAEPIILPDRFEHRIVAVFSPDTRKHCQRANTAVEERPAPYVMKCIDECSLAGAPAQLGGRDMPDPDSARSRQLSAPPRAGARPTILVGLRSDSDQLWHG